MSPNPPDELFVSAHQTLSPYFLTWFQTHFTGHTTVTFFLLKTIANNWQRGACFVLLVWEWQVWGKACKESRGQALEPQDLRSVQQEETLAYQVLPIMIQLEHL